MSTIFAELLEPHRDPRQLAPGGAIGIECEYAIYEDGRQIDVRTIIDDLTRLGIAAGTLRPERGARYRTLDASKFQADGWYAELSVPPEPVSLDAPARLATVVGRGRNWLVELLDGYSAATGRAYTATGASMHFNVQAPDAVPALASRFAATYGPTLLFLTSFPGASGILARPRHGRLELAGEYVDDSERLRACATFLFGAFRAGFDGEAERSLSRDVLGASNVRQGWHLRRTAVSRELDTAVRDAPVTLADETTLPLQTLLDRTWAAIAPHLDGLVSRTEQRLLHDHITGIRRGGMELPPARLERQLEPVTTTGRRGAGGRMLGAALRRTRLGPWRVEPFVVHWDFLVVAARRNGAEHFVNIPRDYLDAYGSGRLNEPLAAVLDVAGPHLPRLNTLSAAARVGIFGSIDEGALATQLEDVLYPGTHAPKKPPPGPCATSIVSPHAIETPLGCVPYLRPHPQFTFDEPMPQHGEEITESLTYSGADGTENGVVTSFRVAGTIADVTGEIVSVTADVTVIDKEHMPAPDGKVPRLVRSSYTAAFTDTNYHFDAIALKGHGHQRVSVTVTNAAALSTTRHLDIEVRRREADANAIEQKNHEVEQFQEDLRKQLEAVTDDPQGTRARAAITRFENRAAVHDREIAALERIANDRPAIHVWASELVPPSSFDDCRFQIHVIDPDPPGEVVAMLISSRDSQEVKLREHAPTHYLSADPPLHALVPPYVGHRGDYPNPQFRKPNALQHDPGPKPVYAKYRPACNAVAMGLQVTISGDSFGYCNADPDGPHPGQVNLVATGLPPVCTVGGEPVRGKYLWEVLEKPTGSSPSIVPPDEAAVQVIVDQPGHYRVRCVYYISQLCSLVCDEYGFDVYEPVPAVASEELVDRADVATGREWLALTADHETADFAFGITMRTVTLEAVPLPGEAEIDWSSLGPGVLATVGPVRTQEGASADVLYPTRKASPTVISVATGVDKLPVDGRDRDVSSLVLGVVLNFPVVAGQAKRLELYGRRGAGEAWQALASIDDPSSTTEPTWSDAGHNLTLKLGRTGNDKLDVQCQPFDAQGNPLEDGSEVDWQLNGTGEVELQGTASTELSGGQAWATLLGGLLSSPVAGCPPSAGAQLLRITFHSATQDEKSPNEREPDPDKPGGKTFWLGSTILGATIAITFVSDTLDTSQAPPWGTPHGRRRIRRDPSNPTQVEVEVALEGRPAAGAELGWSISKGSIQGDGGGTPFSSSSRSILDASGKARATISDIYRSTDGTPNNIHNLAWGEVQIFATVGQPQGDDRFAGADPSAGVLIGEFNDGDLVRRPRNIWPQSNFLRQGNFTFISKPFAAANPTYTADVELQGRPGAAVYNEIVQDRTLAEIVRFDFAYSNFNAPNHDFSGQVNTKLHPPAIDFHMYGLPRSGALVGHGWSTVADNAHAMRIEPSKIASLADWWGTPRGALVQGLTNFEAELWFRPDAVDDDHVVLQGSGENPARGRWAIERRGGGTTGAEVHAIFEGGACDSIPRVSLQTQWVPVRAGGWNKLKLRVSGGADEKQVVVELTANDVSSSRVLSSAFNWLNGDAQRISFGLAKQSWFDIGTLIVRGEINSVMNMVRADGVVVPRQWVVLDANGRGRVKVSTEELHFAPSYPPLPRPQFDLTVAANHVAAFARVVTTYCDMWDFDTEVCPAMSDDAIRIYRGESEAAYGFVFGTGTGWEGFAGDMIAGMVGIGDLRDIIKNLAYLAPGGEDPDWANFGLAVCGLVLSIGEIFSAGADTPENFLVSFLRALLARAKTLKNSRLASVIAEILITLVKEWRYIVKAVQHGLTVYSFWPTIEQLWNFLLHNKTIPRKVSEFAAFVNSLRDRFEVVLSLIMNPIKAKKDLRWTGRLLREMQKTGLPDREIKRAILAMLKGRFTGEVVRVVGAMLDARRARGLATGPVTEKMIRGFAHYVFLHGDAAAARFGARFRDERKLFRILTQIDTLYETLKNKMPKAELAAGMRRLTEPLRRPARNRQFAIHELEIACWFRRFLHTIQPMFRKKQGVDFILKIGKTLVWLEAKSYYTFTRFGRKQLKDKVRKQFIRFVEEQCRQKKVARLNSFAIQYVFRGAREHNSIYAKAIEEAIAEVRHRLPHGFSANNVRILYWGLPRP